MPGLVPGGWREKTDLDLALEEVAPVGGEADLGAD